MNPKPISETDALRSDIEMTRRRMDDTMNALGERMQGRHILDEIIGFFRGHSDSTHETSARVRQKLSQTAEQISDSATHATHAVVDTVKKNPLPFLLITAGAAWLAYSATRGRRSEFEEEDLDESDRYDPDTHYDRPLAYPGGVASEFSESGEMPGDEEGSSKLSQMKETVQDKAATAKEQVKQKLSELGGRTRDTLQSVKERASDLGSKVQDRTREVYGQTRDRVAQTADEHPLELGLGFLVAGALIGLAIPTPSPVNRLAGPTVDRLRNRTRDAGREVMQKGRRVMQAATQAAKQEAESQGLTPDRLRASGQAIGQRAEEAASGALAEEAASACSVDPTENKSPTGTEPADPSAARPAL